jgi:hypothetical protein
MGKHNELRKQRNHESRATANRDSQPWSADELEWLEAWDGSSEMLAELAELLGRTIEACREKFHKSRKTVTVVKVTKQYRKQWMEGDGDGWD